MSPHPKQHFVGLSNVSNTDRSRASATKGHIQRCDVAWSCCSETDHGEVAELVAEVTSSQVTDELCLPSDNSPTALAARPTDVVWKNPGVLHPEMRQLGSTSQFSVTDNTQHHCMTTASKQAATVMVATARIATKLCPCCQAESRRTSPQVRQLRSTSQVSVTDNSLHGPVTTNDKNA